MGSCPIFVSLLPLVYGLINNILGKKTLYQIYTGLID